MRNKPFITVIGIFLLLVLVSAIPQINVNSPVSSFNTTNTSVELNFSIIEENLDNLIYNWDGTNYTVYDDSLLFMINFENNSFIGENSTYVVDVSKYGNNGTITGSPSWNDSGKYEKTMNFDGVNDQIDWPDSDSLEMNAYEDFTFAFWLKYDRTYQRFLTKRIMDDGGANLDKGWGFWLSDHGVHPAICDGTAAQYETAVEVGDSNWHFITITIDRDGNCINYLDADVKNITDCSGWEDKDFSNDRGIRLGTDADGDGSFYFHGKVDSFRLYNRSLSFEEVYQQYISNLQKFNFTQWNLYVNQSRNATSGLDEGTYTYQVFAEDRNGNINSTEERIVTLRTAFGTINNPGTSCTQILDSGDSTGNGVYWIDPDGNGGNASFVAYCDMSAAGGGWTLVAKKIQACSDSGGICEDPNFITANDLYNENYLLSNYSGDENKTTIYRGWQQIGFQELRIVDNTYGFDYSINLTNSSMQTLTGECYVSNINISREINSTLFLHVCSSFYEETDGEAWFLGYSPLINCLGDYCAKTNSFSTMETSATYLNSDSYHYDNGNVSIYVRGNFSAPDSIYPTFSNFEDNNVTLFDSGIGIFNVTVENTNGTVLLEINGTNITATNLGANLYQANHSFTAGGTFQYRWWAYGSGSSALLNNSQEINFTVSSCIQGTNVYCCGNLTQPGIYIVQNDIGTNGSCFFIDSDNITLDLNGKNLTGDNSENHYAIYSIGKKNITLSNGKINSFGRSNQYYSIYFDGVSDSEIKNISTYNNGNAMFLMGCSGLNVHSNVLNEDITGINLFMSSYNNLSNNVVRSMTSLGLFIFMGHYNLINSDNITDSENGIYSQMSSNNRYYNVQTYDNEREFQYDSSSGDIFIYNNSFGIIEFSELTHNVDGDFLFGNGQNIEIKNNSAFLNSTSLSGLNISANVTFFDISTNYTNPVILRDGQYVCDDTTTPSCHNFTSLNSGTVIFNVSSWSNYSIGEEIDSISPTVTLFYPTNNLKTNETNVSFIWKVEDNSELSLSCDLLLNDAIMESDIQCTNNTNCNHTLNNLTWANYSWKVICTDTTNSKNSSENTFMPDWTDIDGDDFHDSVDNLIGVENNVTQDGTTNLSISIGGDSDLVTFSDEKEVVFFDNSVAILNFTHNFSQSKLELKNITIKKSSSYIILNLSGQLQGNKTIIIEDNNFVGLCVKDAEIASIEDMTSSCNGPDEFNFDSCLGGNQTLNGITCIDEGSVIKISNLMHSAIRGHTESPDEIIEADSDDSSFTRRVFTIKNISEIEGYKKFLYERWKINILGNYLIELKDIDGDYVVLLLDGESVRMKAGEEKLIDFEEKKIFIKINSISEYKVELELGFKVEESNPDEVPEKEKQANDIFEKIEKENNFNWIILAVIIILVIFISIIWRRKKKIDWKKGWSK